MVYRFVQIHLDKHLLLKIVIPNSLARTCGKISQDVGITDPLVYFSCYISYFDLMA